MSKINVLVFPSATYPAIQIIDCLKNTLRFHVIAGGSYPNHSEFVCDDVIIDIPYLNAPGFLTRFEEIIKDRNIDFIIPTDETAALILKKNEELLSSKVVCSPFETAMLCRYKRLMYDYLKDERYTPYTYNIREIKSISDYPVFAKPDSGQGSKGALIINGIDDFDKLDNIEDYVICEYLPGEEYTIDCFTDKNRKIIFCNPRVRERLMNGITARGKTFAMTPEFQTIIDSLNERIHFRGYWYVQLKRDKNGVLKLLEVCTRFAGSFAFSKAKGVNLPLLALCDFSDLSTNVVANDYIVECDKTYIDRCRLELVYDHLYIDYDDTITASDGTRVNPMIMAYLYQCKQKGIKISLITRHEASFGESLEESMKKLFIPKTLFDEIIELQWQEKKVDSIRDISNSIFLDNSFKERKDVFEATGMAVFDVCNVDCLFDYR